MYLGARNGIVSVSKVVCDRDGLAALRGGFIADLLHRGAVQADDGHHTRLTGVRCSLHRLPTRLGEFHAVLEGESTGKAKSRVLTYRYIMREK